MKLHLEPEADCLLAQMSWESGLSKVELAEVAVFNLIALWARDKHEKDFVISMDAHDGDTVCK